MHWNALYAVERWGVLGEGLRLSMAHLVEVEIENPALPPRIFIWDPSGPRGRVGADSTRTVPKAFGGRERRKRLAKAIRLAPARSVSPHKSVHLGDAIGS